MAKEKDSEKEKVSDKTENKTEEIFPAPEETRKIGDLLCHERLRKGLDLEDVAQVLCIRRGYLEAIESGNYVELPPLPYSVGFVNSYAKYLGLNNTRIAQLFKEELNLKPADKKVFLPEDMASEASLPDKRYVIGGLADCPVIAVPTSIGYGASFHGVSALLSMLNSCASGVSVVNIDNGFGAGYLASMINHLHDPAGAPKH